MQENLDRNIPILAKESTARRTGCFGLPCRYTLYLAPPHEACSNLRPKRVKALDPVGTRPATASAQPTRTMNLPTHSQMWHSSSMPLGVFVLCSLLAAKQTDAGLYTDPAYLTELRFGICSQWIQPWRSVLETVPAAEFLDGVGVNFDVPDGVDAGLIAQMLGRHGVRLARIEIGWSSIDFDTGKLTEGAKAATRRKLEACKAAGLRPLILLNGNSGAPCPTRFFAVHLIEPAKKGDRTIQVDEVAPFQIGYSGLNNLTDYWAAEDVVTAISGHTLTLSKPLPKDLGLSGATVSCATLKYAPFGDPVGADYAASITGWKKYALEVTALVDQGMRRSAKDAGYDLEVWNELSFGSHFLYRRLYYGGHTPAYREDGIWAALVNATAEVLDSDPARYSGVRLCDGFSNTVPWPASSSEPARVDALSKHPYKGIETYPETKRDNQLLANFQVEAKPSWSPSYTAMFPEFFATGLQTETVLRNSSPITTDIYGTKHGRYARASGPVGCWFTEIGVAPNEIGVQDASAALRLKAKTTCRYLSFYINKGVQRIYFYAACAGDAGLGIVKDRFVEYAKTHHAYPVNDAEFTSPALMAIARMSSLMRINLGSKLTETRPLTVISVVEPRPHEVFPGDGSLQQPALYNREVLALLPYQVNRHRFVIPYYVMSRDVRQDMPEEPFEVVVSGLNKPKSVKAVDVLCGAEMPVKHQGLSNGRVRFLLNATDAPRFLIVEE